MLVDGMITTGHARALLAIEDPELQYTIAQKVFDEKLNVRDIEKLVKLLNRPEKRKSSRIQVLMLISFTDRLKIN